MSLHLLQVYWWCVFSLVGALLGFMLFVQGGQTFLFSFPYNSKDKLLLINLLGRKWELGFTTLVLFGGVAFAAFPRFYAVTFGGAYWLWTLVLLSCVVQAISYEYRKKEGNILGARVFESFLFFNGVVLSLGVGLFVSTLYTGNAFTLSPQGTAIWSNSFLGLDAFFHPFNLLLGGSTFFASRILAQLYFASMVPNIKKYFFLHVAAFLVCFILWLCLVHPFGAPTIFLALGVILFLCGVWRYSVWFGGVGVVLVYFFLLVNVGWNNRLIYPSSSVLSDSLTLANSSGSHYTLLTMFYVSFTVPFVLLCIVYVWYKMDFKKITIQELESDKNSY